MIFSDRLLAPIRYKYPAIISAGVSGISASVSGISASVSGARRTYCFTRLLFFYLNLLVILTSLTCPSVWACEKDADCQGEIDLFFLQLVNKTLVFDDLTRIQPSNVNISSTATTPISLKPVVIIVPTAPAPRVLEKRNSYEILVDLTKWKLEFQENTDIFAEIYLDQEIEADAAWALPRTTTVRGSESCCKGWNQPLVSVSQKLFLPEFASIPTTLTQPLKMTLYCENCLSERLVETFSGTAQLSIFPIRTNSGQMSGGQMSGGQMSEGRIDNINLSTGSGAKASGTLKFQPENLGPGLAADYSATLDLTLKPGAEAKMPDETPLKLDAQIVMWLNGNSRQRECSPHNPAHPNRPAHPNSQVA